jgi:hypothetical protein
MTIPVVRGSGILSFLQSALHLPSRCSRAMFSIGEKGYRRQVERVLQTFVQQEWQPVIFLRVVSGAGCR